MTTLSIEKGKETPQERLLYVYPYQEMDVGDSFVVPVEHRQRVLNANYRAGRRLGLKFTSRTEGNVIRIWRVA